jgi:hypothetical protein
MWFVRMVTRTHYPNERSLILCELRHLRSHTHSDLTPHMSEKIRLTIKVGFQVRVHP